MAWISDRSLHSPEFLALPEYEYEWTLKDAKAAHALSQRTPAFLRTHHLLTLSPDVNAQHVRYLGDINIRTIGQWLDADMDAVMGEKMNRRSTMHAITVALDKLRDATPETFVDRTPWPTGIRNKVLLALSRGLVLHHVQDGSRAGWMFMRPVVTGNTVVGVEEDEHQKERAGTEHGHLFSAKTLHELGVLERLKGDPETLWFNKAGAIEAEERYGKPFSNFAKLRSSKPVLDPQPVDDTPRAPYQHAKINITPTPDPLPPIIAHHEPQTRDEIDEDNVEISFGITLGNGERTLHAEFCGLRREASIPEGMVSVASSCLRNGTPIAAKVGVDVECRQDNCAVNITDASIVLHHDDADMLADLLQHGRDSMEISVDALHVQIIPTTQKAPAEARSPLVRLSPGRVTDDIDGDIDRQLPARGDRRRSDEDYLRSLVRQCDTGVATVRQTTTWAPPMPNLRVLLHAQSRSRMSALKKLVGRSGRREGTPFVQRTHHGRGLEWYDPASSEQNQITLAAMSDLVTGGWARIDQKGAYPTELAEKAGRLASLMTMHFGSNLDEMPSGDMNILPGLKAKEGSPKITDGQLVIIDMDRDAIIPMPFMIEWTSYREYSEFTEKCMEMGYGPDSRAEPAMAWGGLLWPTRPQGIRLHRQIMPRFNMTKFDRDDRNHMMAGFEELRATRHITPEMVPEHDLRLWLDHTRAAEGLTTDAFIQSRHDMIRAKQGLK